jgi:deazaflavin-dependent oxidoreductase (nitroreductase family)
MRYCFRKYQKKKGKIMTQQNDYNDWNQQIIKEFRANEGKVGGQFAGATLLLLHTTGAKSGQERISPLVYQADDGRYLIFASKAGAPTNPDWYHNLLAYPEVTIEVGTETFTVQAVVLEGEERDRLYAKQAALNSNFAAYEKKTTRTIPVVALIR